MSALPRCAAARFCIDTRGADLAPRFPRAVAAAAAPPAHARAAAPSRDGGFGGAVSFDFMDAFREAPPSDSDAARRGEEASEEDDAVPWSDGEAGDSPLPQQLPPVRAPAVAGTRHALAKAPLFARFVC